MPKKLLDLSWKCYQALFSVVEQLKPMPDLPNECRKENYTQLANLCNIKSETRICTDNVGYKSYICQHLYK